VRCSELLPDLRRRCRFVAVRQDGRSREALQALDLRQLGDDVFGDSVAEVFVFLDAAEILEIEDRDRFLTRGCTVVSARIGVCCALRSRRIEIALETEE